MKKYSMILAVFALLLAAVAMTGCSQEGPVAPAGEPATGSGSALDKDALYTVTVQGVIGDPEGNPLPVDTKVVLYVNPTYDRVGQVVDYGEPTATAIHAVEYDTEYSMHYNYHQELNLQVGDCVLVMARGSGYSAVWNGDSWVMRIGFRCVKTGGIYFEEDGWVQP